MHMSSAYPNLFLVSIDSSSARYSVYRTGERGEPCGYATLSFVDRAYRSGCRYRIASDL
jgi:hypothetical protein